MWFHLSKQHGQISEIGQNHEEERRPRHLSASWNPFGLNLIGHGIGQHNDINNIPTMTPQIIQGYVDYLTKKKESRVLELINWPSLSPDLNRIQQIWDLVDLVIDKKPKARQWEQLETIWNSIID